MHRVLLNVPPGMVADHIDGNGLNNTRANLRVCTQAENSFNRRIHSNNKLGVKNVSLESRDGRQFYVVTVKAAGVRRRKQVHSLDEAILWASRLRAEMHGEFASDGVRSMGAA
jgi:hypothetical protein